MLRSIFVVILLAVGAYYALQGPFYALLFYLWYAYFRPEDWLWIDLIKNLHLSLIVGCYVLVVTVLSGRRFIFNGRTTLIFIFLAHTLLSTLLSDHVQYSWLYWKDFLKSTLITYLIIVLVDDFSKFRLALLIMTLSLGFESAKQGWVYLVTSPGWPNANEIAFLGDNNGVAVGMLMLVPILMLLAQTTTRRWGRPFYWFLLVGVLYRAISTYSRGGFLACLALGGVYWLHARHKVRALLAGGVVVAIVLVALPDTYWSRMQTIQTYEEEEDTSALGRIHFWAVALEMAKAHPFFGVGYNAYNPAYDAHDFSHGQYGRGRAVHNSLLAVVAELGYIGLALYLLILLTAMHTCYRLRHRVNADPSLPIGQSAAALSTSLFVFLVGGFFVAFQYQEMLWHFIGLTIALSELAERSISPTTDPTPDKSASEPIGASANVS
jgi:probable O-glycosylation ligase (exosortase A-associated)